MKSLLFTASTHGTRTSLPQIKILIMHGQRKKHDGRNYVRLMRKFGPTLFWRRMNSLPYWRIVEYSSKGTGMISFTGSLNHF